MNSEKENKCQIEEYQNSGRTRKIVIIPRENVLEMREKSKT